MTGPAIRLSESDAERKPPGDSMRRGLVPLYEWWAASAAGHATTTRPERS